jgi:hypothetical protein
LDSSKLEKKNNQILDHQHGQRACQTATGSICTVKQRKRAPNKEQMRQSKQVCLDSINKRKRKQEIWTRKAGFLPKFANLGIYGHYDGYIKSSLLATKASQQK